MYDWPPLKLTVDFIWIDFKFHRQKNKKLLVLLLSLNEENSNIQGSETKQHSFKPKQLSWNAPIHVKTLVHIVFEFDICFFLHCVRFTMNVMCHKCDVVSIDVQYTQSNIHINVQIVSSDCESITLSLSHLLSHQTHTSTRSTLLSSNFIHRAPK